MDTISPQQALTYKEIIANSFKLYKETFTKVIILSFIVAVITFIPRFMILFWGKDIFRTAPLFSFTKLFIVVIDLIGLMFFIGILWRMHSASRGDHETLKDDLKMGVKRLFSVFVAGILLTIVIFSIFVMVYFMQVLLYKYEFLEINSPINIVIITLVFFAEFILIVYSATLFLFTLPIIAVENQGVIKALERSVQLVWDHWWKVFSVQMTPWFCYLLVLAFLRYLLHIDLHIYFIARGIHTPSASILNLILFTLLIPWISALLLVQLQDLEYRKKMLANKND